MQILTLVHLYSCFFNVERFPVSSFQLVITGSNRKGVVSAKTRIEILIDTSRQRMPFTHFLSIPIVSENIKSTFEEFKTDVLQNCLVNVHLLNIIYYL